VPMAQGHAFICLTTSLFVTANFMAHSVKFSILAPLSAYPKQIGLRIIILITSFLCISKSTGTVSSIFAIRLKLIID